MEVDESSLSAFSDGAKGDKGEAGSQGNAGTNGTVGDQGDKGGLRYVFEADTNIAGAVAVGKWRFNQSNTSATQMSFNDLTMDNAQVGNYFQTWDDNNNAGPRGYLIIKNNANGTSGDQSIWEIHGGYTNPNPGISQYDCVFVSGVFPTAASEEYVMEFIPNGSDGAKGDVGPQGPTGLATNGDKGDTGDKGDDGVGTQGAKGADGAQGFPGPTGDKGEIGFGQKGEIGVGEKGQNGAQGLQGPKGNDGVKGIGGSQGLPGLTGPKGVDGIDGDDGAKGDVGPTGLATNGDKGDTGDKGEVGQTGLASDGDDGAKGAKGEVGQTGLASDGAKGAKGSDGYTAYQVAVVNGWNSDEASWLASLIGDDGAKGAKGEVGGAGGDGDDGAKGAKGEIGVGQKGQDGTPGGDGEDGSKGSVGTGVKGEPGFGFEFEHIALNPIARDEIITSEGFSKTFVRIPTSITSDYYLHSIESSFGLSASTGNCIIQIRRVNSAGADTVVANATWTHAAGVLMDTHVLNIASSYVDDLGGDYIYLQCTDGTFDAYGYSATLIWAKV
jgi:hypothetical protein